MRHHLSKNLYAFALDNLKEGVITTDTNFRITYSNQATSLLLNVSQSKLKGSNGVQLLSNHSGAFVKDIFYQLASSHLPFMHETILALDDKILNTTFVKLIENGTFTGSLIMLQDITESVLKTAQLKRLTKKLKRVRGETPPLSCQTSLDQAVISLSHELNTSLTVILGYISLLLNKVRPFDTLRKDMIIIQDEVMHIYTITRTLLNVTASYQGHDTKCSTINNDLLFSINQQHNTDIPSSEG